MCLECHSKPLKYFVKEMLLRRDIPCAHHAWPQKLLLNYHHCLGSYWSCAAELMGREIKELVLGVYCTILQGDKGFRVLALVGFLCNHFRLSTEHFCDSNVFGEWLRMLFYKTHLHRIHQMGKTHLIPLTKPNTTLQRKSSMLHTYKQLPLATSRVDWYKLQEAWDETWLMKSSCP